ncbi:hypothetical protein MPSEU_000114100 [Mayamaea pseudoterrestris]|nr:hypothetical protein MPSEU_000114100 [Mayamaea pseudoterrestris]
MLHKLISTLLQSGKMNAFQLDNIVASQTSEDERNNVERANAVTIPSEFICPITLQIMVCPVMTRAGVNYERSAIISWLQNGSGVCPLTRTPLAPKDIVGNSSLENRIHHWCEANTVELKSDMADLEKVGIVGFVPLHKEKHKKILKRLERKIHESETGVAQPHRHSRNRSHRQSSQRQRQTSSSGRSDRLRSSNETNAPTVNALESSERMCNFRNFVSIARRAAAA